MPGRLAYMGGRWDAVGEHVAQLLALEPERQGTKRLWADAAMHGKRFEQALALREELAAAADKPGSIHLDALVAASAARRWDRVRALAAQLGVEDNGGEGAVSGSWELIRVQFFEDGESYAPFARRTGPATARVTGLAGSFTLQHVHDLVVFDPNGLEQLPEDAEAAGDFVQLYNVVHVLESGNFGPGYLVDGIRPAEAQFAQLTAAIDALGWEWARHSDDEYTVTDSETGEAHPGLYFLVAAPADVAPAVVHEQLTALTAGFAHPMSWERLAEAAGLEEEKHRELAQRFDL